MDNHTHSGLIAISDLVCVFQRAVAADDVFWQSIRDLPENEALDAYRERVMELVNESLRRGEGEN